MNSVSPRILIAHNRYQQRGGEDAVVEDETLLLRGRGHAVETYTRHNDEIGDTSRLDLLRQTLWSKRTTDDLARLFAEFRPSVIHVHNTFPLISPSLYWAAAQAGIPVVQTLHNFRLLCPQAMFLREGRVCEDCLGHLPWRGVVRKCYRSSMAQTSVLTGMLALHRGIGTFSRKVSRFIALTEFSRRKFIDGGLPEQHITVKPNFADMPAPVIGIPRRGFLFVGRLSPEKGIAVLADALKQVPAASLDVIGEGPEVDSVKLLANVRPLGMQNSASVQAAMVGAACLVLPSICYENFPRTLVEAFACGLPVIASRLGAMAELVEDGRTGLLFDPSNATDLAQKLRWVLEHPGEMQAMGENARREYEAKYTPAINYEQLMAIYQNAMQRGRAHGT